MVACNEHMRSVCGDVLEKRKGDNYEIIVGDCMQALNKYISEGKKFDYVFGDLTDIPISTTPTGEIWDFIRTILDASFKVLKPDTGKYMTHGNGVGCPESLRMYEEQLEKLQPAVQFEQTKAFVPSFMEDWVFYQVTVKKQEWLEDGLVGEKRKFDKIEELIAVGGEDVWSICRSGGDVLIGANSRLERTQLLLFR